MYVTFFRSNRRRQPKSVPCYSYCYHRPASESFSWKLPSTLKTHTRPSSGPITTVNPSQFHTLLPLPSICFIIIFMEASVKSQDPYQSLLSTNSSGTNPITLSTANLDPFPKSRDCRPTKAKIIKCIIATTKSYTNSNQLTLQILQNLYIHLT